MRISPRIAVMALFVVLPLTQAQAAPQVLALLATQGATALDCTGDECAAEFSTFCLQQERPTPDTGVAYEAHGDAIALVVTAADGTRRRLPASEHVAISSKRSYTAVQISVPESALRAWDAVGVAVEVGEGVSLVPEELAHNPDSMTAADIALATGPRRRLGEMIVVQSRPEVDAIHVTNALINALPEHGRVTPERRQTLWAETMEPWASALGPKSIQRARELYDVCQGWVTDGKALRLRGCLEVHHDELMIGVNARYWHAAPGS